MEEHLVVLVVFPQVMDILLSPFFFSVYFPVGKTLTFHLCHLHSDTCSVHHILYCFYSIFQFYNMFFVKVLCILC